MSPSLSYDAVVLGAGVAGLSAAARLAEGGARVCVLAKGVGSTHLAPGTVDVLGYAPERVDEPAGALPGFVAAHPDHPYALIGPDAIAPAVEWFAEQGRAAGPSRAIATWAGVEHNHLLPTALGALRPSALVPETMAAGEMRSSAPVCVVGIRVLRDFHASLCAGNLRRAGIEARAVTIDVDVGRTESNSLGLARRFEDPSFRASVASRLVPQLRAGERVALPAILGLRDPHGAWSDLEAQARASGVRDPDAAAVGPGDSRVRHAAGRTARRRRPASCSAPRCSRASARATGSRRSRARTSGHDSVYRTRWVVLATGGLHSGGIALASDWRARETALGLPLAGMPAPGEPRFTADYFATQPMSRVGVAVDWSLRALGHRQRVRRRRGAAGSATVARGLGRGDRARIRVRRRADGAGARGGDGRGMSDHLDLRHEDLRSSLDHCVKCTICETSCPVANVTPLFPGPKYAGPQAERYRDLGEPSLDQSVDYCSGCGLCTMSCPQGVKIAELNAHARYGVKQRDGVPLRDRIITRPTVLGRLGTPVAPLANASLRSRPARLLAERLLGIHRDAPVPKFAGRSFRSWARKPQEPGRPHQGRLLPRLRHRVLRARGRREGRRGARAQRLSGRDPQARLLRAAAAVKRPVRRRAQVRAGARACARATRPGRHADRRQRDQLHADAQARGARDPRPRARSRPGARRQPRV